MREREAISARRVLHSLFDDLLNHVEIVALRGDGISSTTLINLIARYLQVPITNFFDNVATPDTAKLAYWLKRHESHTIAHNERGFRCLTCVTPPAVDIANGAVDDRAFLVPFEWREATTFHYNCSRCRGAIASPTDIATCPRCGVSGCLQFAGTTG